MQAQQARAAAAAQVGCNPSLQATTYASVGSLIDVRSHHATFTRPVESNAYTRQKLTPAHQPVIATPRTAAEVYMQQRAKQQPTLADAMFNPARNYVATDAPQVGPDLRLPTIVDVLVGQPMDSRMQPTTLNRPVESTAYTLLGLSPVQSPVPTAVEVNTILRLEAEKRER